MMSVQPGSFAGVGVGRTYCKDCGIEAWHQWDMEQGSYAHEDFYVHNVLWDRACPDDLLEEVALGNGRVGRNGTYVLCIGCFEARIGRPLASGDFLPEQDPDGHYWSVLVGRPASTRFRQRLACRSVSYGEDGHPLPDTSDVVLRYVPIEEDDEELRRPGKDHA